MTALLRIAGGKRAILLVALSFLVVDCAPTRQVVSASRTDKKLIEGVPFFPDDAYQCGPSSLAGVLNFWGLKDTQQEIAGAIFSPTARGTLGIDLAWYARSKGMRAQRLYGTMEEIRSQIDRGRPLIVFVDLGFGGVSVDHFMVVLGYTPEGVIVNSGKTQFEIIPYERFDHIWSKNKRWTLLITPKT